MAVAPDRDTRQALVEEAVAALRRLTAADLLSAAGIKAIAEGVGVRPATVYHHFGTLEGFAEAVVQRVFSVEDFPVSAITGRIAEITAAPFPNETSLALHRAEFERLTTDPELAVRMGLWAFGGADVAPVYADFLRRIDDQLARFAAALIESWDREPLPPFDLDSLVAASVALLNGTSIRHLVAPGLLDVERYARASSVLWAAMLRLRGDERTLDDRLAETNYYPQQAAIGRAQTDQRRETRAQVLAAAAELFATVGVEATSVARVATAAQVSASTVYSLFRGVPDIAVTLVAEQAAAAFAEADAPDGIVAVLEELAAFLAPRAAFIAPYGHRLVAGDVSADDPLLRRVREALLAAQSAGTARADVDAERTAQVLCTTILSALLTRPAGGPAGAVADACELLLPGLAPAGS